MGRYTGCLTPPRGKQWAENIDDNYNNCFDFIRLVLALLVVLYHCFYLSPNVDRSSTSFAIFAAVYNKTGLPEDLGGLAVSGFFILSGFLITRSWDRTRSAPSYVAKRLMRIGPAFLVASLIGALLVGPITSAGVDHYFKDQHWRAIVANVLTFRPTSVGGAFVGNPTELLNGTLWSIRYEVDCYILVAIVGVFWFQAGRILIALAAVFSVLFVMDQWGYQLLPHIDHGIAYFLTSSPDEWPRWFSFFLAGSLFYVYRRHIPRSLILFAVSVTLMLLSILVSQLNVFLPFFMSYAILFTASLGKVRMSIGGHRLDPSYGAYVYGWIIQQLLVFYFALSVWQLWWCWLATTLLVASFSWLVIEQPCLKLAHEFARSSKGDKVGWWIWPAQTIRLRISALRRRQTPDQSILCISSGSLSSLVAERRPGSSSK